MGMEENGIEEENGWEANVEEKYKKGGKMKETKMELKWEKKK